jgi:hypothetical protein
MSTVPKNLLVINTQSFGDILLSTHIGRISKKYFPEMQVHIAVRDNLTLTTAENDPSALQDLLYIISLQENIKSTGFIANGLYYNPIFHNNLNLNDLTKNTEVLVIQGWSSDLGIVKSQLKPFYDMFKITDPIDTETKFNFLGAGKTTDQLTVGLVGELDFIRKWHNKVEYQKFLDQISSKKYNMNIIKFGVDVEKEKYSEQLTKLASCNLIIAPMGSIIHAAAGLGIDTISLTSVFPSIYDCPEFYHTGWHKSIKQMFPYKCGNYACVTEKKYDNQTSWGNPPTEFGFWPENCPHTINQKSCNFNITADMIIEKFEDWYNENSKI